MLQFSPHNHNQFHAHSILVTNNGGIGMGRGWLIFIRMWVGGQKVGIIFFFCFWNLFCHILSAFIWVTRA